MGSAPRTRTSLTKKSSHFLQSDRLYVPTRTGRVLKSAETDPQAVHTGPFSLVKWYLDCVRDAGDAVILYCADLRWRGLHAMMGSILESRAGHEPQTRTSLGRFRV